MNSTFVEVSVGLGDGLRVLTFVFGLVLPFVEVGGMAGMGLPITTVCACMMMDVGRSNIAGL